MDWQDITCNFNKDGTSYFEKKLPQEDISFTGHSLVTRDSLRCKRKHMPFLVCMKLENYILFFHNNLVRRRSNHVMFIKGRNKQPPALKH